MKIKINGEETTTAEGLSLLDLLAEQGFKPESVVVELNAVVVERDFAAVTLKDGDSLEVLHFVGGG